MFGLDQLHNGHTGTGAGIPGQRQRSLETGSCFIGSTVHHTTLIHGVLQYVLTHGGYTILIYSTWIKHTHTLEELLYYM